DVLRSTAPRVVDLGAVVLPCPVMLVGSSEDQNIAPLRFYRSVLVPANRHRSRIPEGPRGGIVAFGRRQYFSLSGGASQHDHAPVGEERRSVPGALVPHAPCV